MASQQTTETETAETAPADTTPAAPPPDNRRNQVVKPGRLPISEFLFDRAGAASPFGEDVSFPLPVDDLRL